LAVIVCIAATWRIQDEYILYSLYCVYRKLV